MVGFWRGLLASVLVLATVAAVLACDAVVVGRLASADGSVLLGHNEENALDRVIRTPSGPYLLSSAAIGRWRPALRPTG